MNSNWIWKWQIVSNEVWVVPFSIVTKRNGVCVSSDPGSRGVFFPKQPGTRKFWKAHVLIATIPLCTHTETCTYWADSMLKSGQIILHCIWLVTPQNNYGRYGMEIKLWHPHSYCWGNDEIIFEPIRRYYCDHRSGHDIAMVSTSPHRIQYSCPEEQGWKYRKRFVLHRWQVKRKRVNFYDL